MKDHETKGNMIQLCVTSELQGKLKESSALNLVCEINYENEVNNFLKRLFSRTFVKFPRSVQKTTSFKGPFTPTKNDSENYL